MIMYLLQRGWLWEEEKLSGVCVREMESKSYLQLYTSLRGTKTKGVLFKLAPNMKFSSDQKSDYRKEQQECTVDIKILPALPLSLPVDTPMVSI